MSETLTSPLGMMFKWEAEMPNTMYMRQPINREYVTWTWKETATEVRKMAAYLKSLDLEPGSRVGILSKNCAHWIMSDLAIMMAGHVSVPMYPNLNAETVRQILEHSGTKVLFVGKLDDYPSMKPGVPENVKCISYPYYAHKEYDNWKDLIANVEPLGGSEEVDLQALATIIYTSGTTGMPKGVMHKFHNFAFAVHNALKVVKLEGEEKYFSYLPLSHIAERVLVEMGSLYSGGLVSFAESLDTFPEDLANTQPTVFLGVPRIWGKFQQGVLSKFSQGKLDFLTSIPLLGGLIKNKIKTKLGLSVARNVFTGAAPTPAALINWYKKLGINIQEAYAMTENCCYSHVTTNDWIKIGKVGRALPYCDVKLSDQNEIMIKHEALMDGYYKEAELTAETLVDGYLRTGDEGAIDSDGFLKITGRVKDLFKTSKGKYIAPAPIELAFSANTDIEQVCVVGVGLPQPIALVVPSEQGKGLDSGALSTSLENTRVSINETLDAHENLKKIVVLKDEWTVENGLLTPTLKVKRSPLEKMHSPNYNSWYEDSKPVVFEN